MLQNPIELNHKAVLDSLLSKIPGVEVGEMTGLPAYFVGKRMFACICNGGVGIRLPTAEAANLQFSRGDVIPFQPKGKPSSREWIQIDRNNSAEYEKDLPIFQASIDFVSGAKA
jgi:hypothetical protein